MTAPAVERRPDLRIRSNSPPVATGSAPRAEPTLIGTAKRRKRPPREPGLVERLFDRWWATATPGAEFVYHKGDLASARQHDRALAAFADRLQHLSTGRWDVITKCGHCRGEVVGSGQLALLTRRVQGESVYIVRKR
jgi:hypothetical protein